MRRLLFLVVIALTVACVGPFSEWQQNAYPDRAAARAADPSGWIPAILPADATAIREAHRLDTGATWGCFHTQRTEDGARAPRRPWRRQGVGTG